MTIETTRPTIVVSTPRADASAGAKPPAPTITRPAPMTDSSGREQTSPQASRPAAPVVHSPAGSQTGRDHRVREAHIGSVSATNFPGDQPDGDSHLGLVAGERDQPTAITPPITTGTAPSAADDPRTANVPPTARGHTPSGGFEQGPPATRDDLAPREATLLADPFLALAADVLDDLEKVRIANENRLRQLVRGGPADPRLKANGGKYEAIDDLPVDKDGEDRGFAGPADAPQVIRLGSMVAAMRCDSKILPGLGFEKQRKGKGCCLEHDAERNLAQAIREHPLGPWVKANPGVGEKQAARLLAAIGDPYWNTLHDRPRTVYELNAYCGLVPGQKRRRGIKSNWSAAAKMRAWNVAQSMLKAGNRADYDRRKAATEGRVHSEPCVRCGPSGHPAPAGTPWSDAHRHADALRIVSKELLKALWREAKRIHELPGGQSRSGTHSPSAAGSQPQEDQ